MFRNYLLTLAGLLLICASCGDRPPGEGVPLAGGAAGESGVAQQHITAGTATSDYPTVGQLVNSSGSCTATLIGKHTVLTAGHCVSASSLSFTVGGVKYTSSKVIRHPGYGGGNDDDLALVILPQEVTGISPTPLNIAAPIVGQEVALVGYGATSESSTGVGVKRFGLNTVSEVADTTFSFRGQSNVCFGDSGGPTFVTVNGVETIAGVHSTRLNYCGYGGTDMRVDRYLDWIKTSAEGDVILPQAPPSVPDPVEPPEEPAPSEPPAEEPPLALEGESCADDACAEGLGCVTVYSSGYVRVVGQFCMEQCQTAGNDPICDGGEVCTNSRSAGLVCFKSGSPESGYTNRQ